MITTMELANTSATSLNYHLFFVARTFKIFSQSIRYSIMNSNHSAVNGSLELIHLLTGSVPFDQYLLTSPRPPPTFCYCEFTFFIFHI